MLIFFLDYNHFEMLSTETYTLFNPQNSHHGRLAQYLTFLARKIP